MTNLLLGIGMLLIGPLVWNFCESKNLLPWVNKITAICVGALVIIHILPESFAVIGWWSVAAGAAGFVIFYLIEYLWFLPQKKLRKISVTIVLIGLCLHMIMDGVGLSHGHHHGHDHGHGHGHDVLSWAIFIHRLPAGLLLWSVLKDTFSKRMTFLFYGGFVVFTASGFVLGEELIHVLGDFELQLMQAFIGGALAHVVMDFLVPHRHKGECPYGHGHSH